LGKERKKFPTTNLPLKALRSEFIPTYKLKTLKLKIEFYVVPGRLNVPRNPKKLNTLLT
jgi:hypothetical protein